MTDYTLKSSTFKATDHDEDENRDDKIFKELQKISKKETRNAANIKAIFQKLVEQEDSETFEFPLQNEDEYENFEKCLLKKSFTKKLVYFLSF